MEYNDEIYENEKTIAGAYVEGTKLVFVGDIARVEGTVLIIE